MYTYPYGMRLKVDRKWPHTAQSYSETKTHRSVRQYCEFLSPSVPDSVMHRVDVNQRGFSTLLTRKERPVRYLKVSEHLGSIDQGLNPAQFRLGTRTRRSVSACACVRPTPKGGTICLRKRLQCAQHEQADAFSLLPCSVSHCSGCPRSASVSCQGSS